MADTQSQDQDTSFQEKDAKKEELNKKAVDKLIGDSYARNVMSEANFKLPTMGEYYLGAVDDTYLRMIDAKVHDKSVKDADGKKAAFYAENPPMKEFSHDKDNDLYFLQAEPNVTDNDLELGLTNGLNIRMNVSNVSGNDDAVKDLYSRLGDNSMGYFTMHLIGISGPTTPKWATEYNVTLEGWDSITCTKTQADASGHSGYVYVPNADDNHLINFVNICGKFREYEVLSKTDSTITFRWLMDKGTDSVAWNPDKEVPNGETAENGSNLKPEKKGAVESNDNAGQRLAKKLQNIINMRGNGTIYFVLDGCGMSDSSKNYPISIQGAKGNVAYQSDLNYFSKKTNDDGSYTSLVSSDEIPYTGSFLSDEEVSRRFDATVYIKINDQYVNVAKLMLGDTDISGVQPDENYEGPNKNTFKPSDYDEAAREYADAFFETMSQLDDRPQMQKEVMGMEWTSMLNWDVTLGDVTFFVPPVNITTTVESVSERMPLLRANGSMTKTASHTMRKLSLELYFNEDRGINGYAYKTKLPKGGEVTYDVNGLRSLIAQFKFVPFVPITNNYINKTLGIDAVTVTGLHISSMEGFPKLIHATISMMEFDWVVYMPTLTQPMLPKYAPDKNGYNQFVNYFALSINWRTLRYYYQRPIKRGNYVHSLGLAANDENYVKATMGDKTILQPMNFEDPTIKFYMADEEYLQDILKSKMNMLKGNGDKTSITFDDKQKAMLQNLSKIYASVQKAAASDNLKRIEGNTNLQWEGSETGAETTSLAHIGKSWSNKNGRYIDNFNGLEYTGSDGVDSGIGTSIFNTSEYGKDASKDSPEAQLNRALETIHDQISDDAQADSNGAFDWNGCNFSSGVEHPDSNTRRYTFWLEYDLDPDAMNDTEVQAFKQNMSSFTGVPTDDILRDNKIHIPISIDMKKSANGNYYAEKGQGFHIYTDAPDMMLLANASDVYDKYKDKDPDVESVPDENKLKNIPFDAYDCGTVRIKSYECNFSNRISMARALDVDGSAPQYLGGNDTSFSVIIETTDQKSAKALINLPKKIAKLSRKYHMVLPCCPLRVDSEISRFIGVNEVSLENVTLVTSNEMTGVYILQMEMLSMNRTLRNREVASKYMLNNGRKELTESDNVAVTGQQDKSRDTFDFNGDGLNQHAGNGVMDRHVMSDYFKLDANLAKAELYPDLELPTIQEMEDAGWYYTRYKFEDDRVFVDPDFYFVYVTTLTSQYYREAAIRGMSADIGKTTFQDPSGGKIQIDAQPGKGFQVLDKNDIALKQAQTLKETNEARKQLETKLKDENLKENNGAKKDAVANYIAKSNLGNERQCWNVCKAINPIFLEDRYLKEYRSYCARMEAQAAGITNPTHGASDIVGSNGADVYGGDDITLLDGTVLDNAKAAAILKDTSGKYSDDDLAKAKQYAHSHPNDSAATIMSQQEDQKAKEAQQKAAAADGSGDSNQQTAANTSADSANSADASTDPNAKKSDEDIVTEGSYVFNALENAASASEMIKEYLENTAIAASPTEVSGKKQLTDAEIIADFEKAYGRKPSQQEIDLTKNAPNTNKAPEERDLSKRFDKSTIASRVTNFFNGGDGAPSTDIWYGLNIEVNETFLNTVTEIVYSAACAGSGAKEYSGDDKASEWKPKYTYYGMKSGGYQDKDKPMEIEDPADIGPYAITFGCYNLRLYSDSEYYQITGKTAPTDRADSAGTINETLCSLDPYYAKANEATIEEYKTSCALDPVYCTDAFLRIMLVHLALLIDRHAIPSIGADTQRKAVTTEVDIEKTQKDKGVEEANNVKDDDTGAIESLNSFMSFFQSRLPAIDAGKIWTASVLAASGGDAQIVDKIDKRDYAALDGYVESASSPETNVDPTQNGIMAIRKMTLALVGEKVIDEQEAQGITATSPTQQYDLDKSEKKYIKAAEDPDTYIPHMFHDMVVNDARGRMLRAFPTFYMCFVDEGRDVGTGLWKLNDNFYNTSAIMEMEIVKSRKLPADTANITMSNFYNTYTTESSDYQTTAPTITMKDTYNSIFSPSDYFKKEQARRSAKPPEPKLRLRPGARIHIRLGYGSNAAMLPVVFNGVIAEVSAEETVNIVAQGDGIELMNPIMLDGVFEKDAKNLDKKDDILPGGWKNSKTPLQIATALFNTHGGLIRRQLRERVHTSLFERNPFGIVHFGNPDFKGLSLNGECVQNLYEATTSPIWAGNSDVNACGYGDEGKSRIDFNLFKKTPWDCLNICKSITPDFRLAVLPFGFRSTVFMGMPRYYYAYAYTKNENGSILEKRKPFCQAHVYSSYEDIIGNGITATNRDMKTAAKGMYTIESVLTVQRQSSVGPLYADFDIYPDAQKTMIVDTNLIGKGTPIANLTGANDFLDGFGDDEGSFQSHEAIAWKATASKLRESIEDMYAGDLIVYGDPSVKPQDRFYISDAFTGMTGQAMVKEVVHHLSVDNGFTTTISPDVIATVDDPHEMITNIAIGRIGAMCSGVSNLGVMSTLGTYSLQTALKDDPNVKKAQEQIKQESAPEKAKQVAKDEVQTAAEIGGGLLAVGGLILVGALAPFTIPGVIAGISIAVSSAYVNSLIKREIKNLKVIQLFPLKRYGITYTAGFEGSKGCVFGSPSYSDSGIMGDISSFLSDNTAGKFIDKCLVSNETDALLNKFKRENGVIDSNGNPKEASGSYGKYLSENLNSKANTKNNPLAAQQMEHMATYDCPGDVKNSYDNFKIMDVDNYSNDPKLAENNKVISDDTRIKPYIDEQFFQTVHEVPSLREGKNVTEEALDMGGKKRIKAIHDTDTKGNAVVDLPVLNPNAMNVLYEILRRAKNKMPGANATDSLEDYESTKTTYIVLKSALRVGDQSTQAAAGFTFVLQPTDDNAKKALKAALEELTREISDDAKKYDNANMNGCLFHYKENEGNEVAIVCAMPVVTSDAKNDKDKDGDGRVDKTEEQLAKDKAEKEAAEEDYEEDDDSNNNGNNGGSNSGSLSSSKSNSSSGSSSTSKDNNNNNDSKDSGKDTEDNTGKDDDKDTDKDKDKMSKSRKECMDDQVKQYIAKAKPLFKLMEACFTGYNAESPSEKIAIIHYRKFYKNELKNFDNGTYSDIESMLTSDEGRNILKNVGFVHRKELLNLYRTFIKEYQRIKNLPKTDFPNPESEYDPDQLDEKGNPKATVTKTDTEKKK